MDSIAMKILGTAQFALEITVPPGDRVYEPPESVACRSYLGHCISQMKMKYAASKSAILRDTIMNFFIPYITVHSS
jgi:hypothetical protein